MAARVLYLVGDVDLLFGGSGSKSTDALEEALEDIDRLPTTVSSVAERLRAVGIETTVHATRIAPTDAIIDIVAAMVADAVVIGYRRRPPIGEVVFGSVAQEVIRRVDCPITVTPW